MKIRTHKKEVNVRNESDCRKCGGSGIFNSSKCDLCKGDGKVRYCKCLDCQRRIAMQDRFHKICYSCKSKINNDSYREPYRVVF